jgi:hypothetical protein
MSYYNPACNACNQRATSVQLLHARKTSINERQKGVRAIEYSRTHKTITRSQYVKLDLDELVKKEGKGKRTSYRLV